MDLHLNNMLTSREMSTFPHLPLLFTQEKKEKTSAIPVLQPFICSEEKKSPIFQEDPMDTLEELPVADIGDTYLTDEQFNQKYPQHTIDVSFSVNNSSNS